MTNSMTAGLGPTHPGKVLREIVIPAVDIPKAEIARLLGVSRQHLHDILNERKPITPQMALRLAKMFGGTAGTWLMLQMNFDLAVMEPAMARELAEIPAIGGRVTDCRV